MTFNIEKYISIVCISAFIVSAVVLPIYSSTIRSKRDGGGGRRGRDDDESDTDTKCFKVWFWTAIISALSTSAVTILISTYVANKK